MNSNCSKKELDTRKEASEVGSAHLSRCLMQRNDTAVLGWLTLLAHKYLLSLYPRQVLGLGGAGMQVNRQAETLTVQTLSLVGETDIDQRHKHVIICDKKECTRV